MLCHARYISAAGVPMQGSTRLLVTHQRQHLPACDRIIVLRDGRISCEVRFGGSHPYAGQWLPYTADADDPDPRSIGRELHLRSSLDPALSSEQLEPSVIEAEEARRARAKRNRLLAETDWTQLADIPAATRALYKEYRQKLRDITEQPGFPRHVEWPTPPAA